MTELTDDELKQIRKRWAAAPEGPWRWADPSEIVLPENRYDGPKYGEWLLRDANGVKLIPVRVDHYEQIYDVPPGEYGVDVEVRECIKHATEDVRRLLAEVGRLKERVAELEGNDATD